jgi:hypothetical protein
MPIIIKTKLNRRKYLHEYLIYYIYSLRITIFCLYWNFLNVIARHSQTLTSPVGTVTKWTDEEWHMVMFICIHNVENHLKKISQSF